MRLGLGAALSFFTLVSVATSATAETRCSASPVRVCDGCSATIRWTVTQAVPGGRHNFCHVSWQSLGGHAQFAMVKSPQLGKGSFKDYRVVYTGNRLGHDSMVVKMSWLSRSNRTMTGTVTYDINVVQSQ